MREIRPPFLGGDLDLQRPVVERIRNTFAPRLEYDDRLRVIEQKLGIPSPQ